MRYRGGAEAHDRHHVNTVHEGRLFGIRGRYQDSREAGLAGCEHRGKHPGNRAKPPVQPELAEMDGARRRRGGDLPRGGQGGHGYGEVEAR
ncbi:MAG TPA: hypothetical protein VL422_09100, partial [Miltoncostaea sp.]|nr:hypothetical protein [Miltoncostaea sp.]